MNRKEEFMTARELARRLNEPYTTVAGWLQRNLVPGAEAQMVGTFKVWVIPVSVVDTVKTWRPKMGRPPLTDEEKAARAKARTKNSAAKKSKIGENTSK
jgi:hypothetical protein